MSFVSLENRLRPIRFGFLVRPADEASLQKVFEINTCLWGGKFNSIIPYFDRVPKWWLNGEPRTENAREIVNGYLDFFEPDILVEAEPGLASKFGFGESRVRQLSDFLVSVAGHDNGSCGQDVLDLYSYLYRKEFQFVRRNPHNIIAVSAPAKLKGFSSCVFGAFPSEERLRYFERAFEDAFGPQLLNLDPDNYDAILRQRAISALQVAQSFMDVHYNEYGDPTLFLMNPESSVDLIDYWNLRCFRRTVLPIPIQWTEPLSEFCREFIRQNHKPLNGNPHGVMRRISIVYSRTVPLEKAANSFNASIGAEDKNAHYRENYPSFWRRQPSFVMSYQRATLESKSQNTNIAVGLERPDLRFETLSPPFAEPAGTRLRWANVVQIRDWTGRDKFATTYPTDTRHSKALKLGFVDAVHYTTEGFVFLPGLADFPTHWRLSEGATAINDWLGSLGIAAQPSDGGIAAQQIIATLGGFRGVESVANAEIIKLLDSMARSSVSRCFPHKKFRDLVSKASREDIWEVRRFETLVESRAVELGLRLRCTKCSSWSWYPLGELSYEMKCELCLQNFQFPLTEPGKPGRATWAYRVIGPFALDNFARGGYASALSIRFFAEAFRSSMDTKAAWSSGKELSIDGASPMEVDFIVWLQGARPLHQGHKTEVIFGEAKSFGRESFSDDDIAKMQKIACKFPGALIVFSTLKDGSDLTPHERQRIAKLALWGRERIEGRNESRAPVILLTGTELFSSLGFQSAWKKKGGRHEELLDHYRHNVDRLHTLADMTQQLYLDIPSYFSWRSERYKKMARRKAIHGR